MPAARVATLNAVMLRKLAVMAAVMFAFGFALVPFYKSICELTGVNRIVKADAAETGASAVDATRTVTIEFDASPRADWSFRPVRHSLDAHPGELVTIEYEITNHAARDIVGQAIPSYAPVQAAAHLRKLECFCFRQQLLRAGETRRFPVVFVIDRALPREVATVTLSYTFFEIPGGSLAAVGGARSGATTARAGDGA
ncbi:cytochrome c oxidase assembly protein [Derxia gummosa]|uniref:Cytochrome c oxidase assembly protein CtaG n=1 Tax=Derxia gummosa DSM 723 TaxID=1121388 RepID=A0A8B6X5G9_9BURK|nr:cytochrome c oxidase assembly protein [Derxia gummosa]